MKGFLVQLGYVQVLAVFCCVLQPGRSSRESKQSGYLLLLDHHHQEHEARPMQRREDEIDDSERDGKPAETVRFQYLPKCRHHECRRRVRKTRRSP
ncbi:hypothetical protein V8F06_006379 [Rhypophila decipiens]